MAEINITPFTDVLLVLLIIFMILAAIQTPPGFEKELPNNNNNNPATNTPHNDIEVDINNRGKILVDGVTADQNSVYYIMAQTRAKKGDKHVSIVADAKAPYGIIVRVLDAAQAAGLDNVGFVTSS